MKKLFFLFLFFCNFSYAGELPENVDVEVFDDWSGGLNTEVVSHKLPKNQTPSLQNMFIDEKEGSLVTVRGFTQSVATVTLGKINFQFEYNKDDGSSEFIVSDSSILLTTSDLVSFTLLKTGLTATSRLRAVQIRKKVWFVDGVNRPFTYDGSTVVVLDGGTYGGIKTPIVPKGLHIAYWLNRVWIGNTTDDVTELAFSAISTTDSIPIAIVPDSEWAWRDTHKLYIGRGNGQSITALFLDKSQLKVGKTKSIYTIFGTDVSNFRELITNSHTGIVSNFSISGLEDYTYFVGQNNADFAVYAFDGQDTLPVSENIRNRIENASNDQNRVISNIWETKTDFNRGTYYNSTSTLLNSDILTIETSGYANAITVGTLDNANSISFTNTGSSSTEFITVIANQLPSNFSGNFSTITFRAIATGGDGACGSGVQTPKVEIVFRNTATLNTVTFISPMPNIRDPINITTGTMGVKVSSKTDFDNNNWTYKITLDTSPCVNSGIIRISSVGENGNSNILLSTNTSQFVSEITTITTLTLWDTFDADHQTNAGTVKYYVRTATSIVNMSTPIWTEIALGNVINAGSSNKYVQWSATISALNINLPPTIDNVKIKHNEGTSSLGLPFSYSWKGRYLLFVSTLTDGSYFVGYWKSKFSVTNKNSWTYVNGYPIFSIAEFKENLYGGGDGKIYRLDNGTNFNGTPIISFYQIPDTSMKNPFFDKTLDSYVIDLEKKSGGNLKLGFSLNKSSFTDTSISIDGTGRLIKTLFYPNETGNLFSWRFMNDELDKGLEFHRFAVIYNPTRRRSGD